MPSEDPDRTRREIHSSATLNVGALQMTILDAVETPQRRRLPRRQIVGPVLTERRRSDRRQSKRGVDGLLRAVLADSWK